MAPAMSPFDRKLAGLRRRQVRRILDSRPRYMPGSYRTISLLRESLGSANPSARRCLLLSPLLGGWLQDALFWQEALRRSSRVLSGKESRYDRMRLFDLMSRSEFLPETVPAGRLDAAFPRRVQRRARRVLSARLADLPRILWPHLPERSIVPIRFALSENSDEGCPEGTARLGLTQALLVRRKGNSGRTLVGRLGIRGLILPEGVELRLHETVPGTSMLLSHRLVSKAGSLRVGARIPGLGRRVARALRLVGLAWPQAQDEIVRRTWLLVPLVEPGTVSYSHLSRPGISYINVFRGTLLDLADDLVHETAHHRLHAWQEIISFARDDSEQRYDSPWRRGLRPVNGILHGTFTFLDRAELLLRLAGARSTLTPSRRRTTRAEARRELKRCRRSLRELESARQDGLLTDAGTKLCRAMQRRVRALEEGRLSGDGLFSIF